MHHRPPVRTGWDASPTSSPPSPAVADALAIGLIAIAFGMAIWVTYDLTWPPRWDFYREMGSIQAILDGRGGGDPLFLGEARWYNPLVPQLLAAGSAFADVPVPTFVTRAGPYLNLLVPIGFYALFRRLIGPWPAAIGLTVFLFWPAPYLPENSAGAYSPWAWPRNIAQGLYFVAALALLPAARTGRVVWALVAGVLIGVTFLAHTAPALMLAASAVMLGTVSVPRRAAGVTRLASLRWLVIAGAAALATALPYLLPLAEAYRFHVLNRAPMNTVGLSVLAMAASLLSPRFILAVVGIVVLVRAVRERAGRWPDASVHLVCLIGGCLVWLGLGVGYQILLRGFGIDLIQVVPEYHFHLYFKSFEAALAGVGIVALADRLRERIAGRWGWGRGVDGTHARRNVALVGACVLVIGVNLRGYLASPELRLFRQESLARQAQPHFAAFYEWALASTAPDDVFLADDFHSLFAVSPTGRKVVAIYPFYANPYVAIEPRRQQRAELFEWLNAGDVERFVAAARAAGVTYVMATERADACCRVTREFTDDRLPVVFADGPIRVHRVR